MEDINIEQEHEDHGNYLYKKDWFAPAMASMARLNQIQSSVYDMGFHNVTSLKVSPNVRHKSKPPRYTETSPNQLVDSNLNANEIKQVRYTDLKSTPPLSTVSYQQSAWGSNQSIPELIAQQGKKITSLRPSSAKVPTSARLRRNSQNRPHSAKEPLCHDQDNDKIKSFGVCGQRKSVLSTKPPAKGYTPLQGARNNISNGHGGAWAGPPPGHEVQPGNYIADEVAEENFEPMRVPPSSPEPEDNLSDVNNGPKTPPLLRRPLSAPIHLSLPSVNESADVREDSMDVTDDMDTERLLKQAVCFVNQEKTREEDIVSGNTTLPDEYYEEKEVEQWENDTKMKSSENKIIEKFNYEKFSPKDKASSLRNHKSKTFLSPDNKDSTFRPLPRKEESQNNKTNAKKSNINSKTPVGVRIREDKNITVDITPRNIGRKVNDTVSSASEDYRSRISTRQDADSSTGTANKKLVSMVNLDYQDYGDGDSSNKKSKSRKKKTIDEVETVVSQLSKLCDYDDEETSNTGATPVSQILHKSEAERNYFELSRSQSRLSNLSDSSRKEENVFYKTTKTLEFCEDALQETSSKTAIKNSIVNKQKPPVQHRPPRPTSALMSSQNKTEKQGKSQQTVNEDVMTEVEIKSEAQKNVEKLSDILQEAKSMAETSLYNAKRSRPTSGKKIVSQKSNNNNMNNFCGNKSRLRPFSAGSKPSTVSDVISKSRTDSSKTSNRFLMYSAKSRTPCCRHSERGTGRTNKPVIITSVKQTFPIKSAESSHCKEMQSRMAQLGVDVDPNILERALYAPIGEPLHYEVPGGLPKDLSAGLLSHYKYWLSEDYKRIQLMEKRLAQDDHIKYLQKLAAEKKAKKALEKESKGKKKKKLQRSNSVT